ncbi:hypothetical protein [Pseudomonas savastanoi]|uniref:hypothetical protein n=1 Tax=Pseudomonas savastanoi TaxID=29438 RepID=UPI00177CC26D|nr:hypothetical protein [Pseudomonas savastanoi]QOI07907.1 hypothetical protein D5S10_29735 [Pseudomonas savastanoi]
MSDSRGSSSVLVPAEMMADFNKRLVSLNAKAVRFGLEPIVASEPRTNRYYYDVKYEGRDNDVMTRTLTRLKPGSNPPKGEPIVLANAIDLDYPIVKLGNWRVLAQLESFQGANLVFSVATDSLSEQALEAYAKCPIECEHCNTHRNRKLSYVLKDNESDDIKQVGSSCLEDFTGVDPAAALFLAKVYDFVKVVDCYNDFENGSFSGKASAYATDEYVTRVLFLSERYGFVSSTKAKDEGCQATFDLASQLDSLLRNDSDVLQSYSDQHSRHRETAQAIIDWYAVKEPADSFERNLKLLLAAPDVLMDRKHMAFVAASVPSYHRHLKKLLAETSVGDKPSEHVGTKGDKKVEPVKLEGIFGFDTQFGVNYRVNMRDEAGNKLSWKTANPPPQLREAGAIGLPFIAQFKIKDHGEFRGSLITEVSHLKFKSWVVEHAAENSDWQPAEVVSVVINNTSTSSFSDIGSVAELSLIFANASSLVRHGWDGNELGLADTNGNSVGSIKISSLPMGSSFSPGAVSVRMPLGPDVAKSLEVVAKHLESAVPDKAKLIRDEHGEVIAQLFVGRDALIPRDSSEPVRTGALDM